MSRKQLPVNLYSYHDHKVFLLDLFNHWKTTHYRYSYRKFSKAAGFTSPNMLKQVIEGKRRLSRKSIDKITGVFGFNQSEKEFFTNLVFMNQAATHKQKNLYYKRLGKAARYTLANRNEKDLYTFYSKWYYPVIRELVTTKGFRDTPSWLAKRVYPSITAGEAERAVSVLEKTGHIKRKNGRWIQTSPLSATGSEVTSLAVTNYHKAMISKAGQALDALSHEERNVSSLTMAVSPETYRTMVAEIQSLQQRLIELANAESGPDDVYQVNFQVFPVTRPQERSKE